MNIENLHIIAYYHDVFNDLKKNPEDIFPQAVPAELFVAFSLFSWKNNAKLINEFFLKKVKPDDKITNNINNKCIIKRPNNLIVWYFLAPKCCVELSWAGLDGFNGIENLTRCLLIANERESILENNDGYSLNNPVHFYRDNFTKQLYRAISLYINDNYLEKYTEDFKAAYGVSINEYMVIVHLLSSCYNDMSQKEQYNGWCCTIKDIVRMTKIPAATVEKTINLVSFRSADLEKMPFESVTEKKVKIFNNTPYFFVTEDKFVPVDGKLAENLTFHNLFYKVKKAAQNKSQFMIDYGHAFERYVSSIVRQACKNSHPVQYQFIDEFEYNKPNVKHSSDVYIHYYDAMIKKEIIIVIEVKSARILDRVKSELPAGGDITKSLNKTIVSPLNQMLKVTSELIDGHHHPVITQDKFYFFVAVSMESFPILLDKRELELTAPESQALKVGGLISMSIEELELLVSIMMSDSPLSPSYLISHYRQTESVMSFKTFLNRVINHHKINCRQYHSSAERTFKQFLEKYINF